MCRILLMSALIAVLSGRNNMEAKLAAEAEAAATRAEQVRRQLHRDLTGRSDPQGCRTFDPEYDRHSINDPAYEKTV